MVVTTLLSQGLHYSTLADMNLPTRWHNLADSYHNHPDGDPIHWVGPVIALLKLGVPVVLAIAGIIYRATRRRSGTSDAHAPNKSVIAPWQPAPAQPGGGYTPHSRPVAPWQPAASIAPAEPATSERHGTAARPGLPGHCLASAVRAGPAPVTQDIAPPPAERLRPT